MDLYSHSIVMDLCSHGLGEYGLVAQKLEVYCSENACSALLSAFSPALFWLLRLTFRTSHRLPVYVSSAHDDANLVFRRARIHPSRIHIDNRALDTVITVKGVLYISVWCVRGVFGLFRSLLPALSFPFV